MELPRGGLMVAQFYEGIYDCFQNYNYKNAIFLAERLRVLYDNENHTVMLAECYLADNAPYKAYSVLKGLKSKRARYLFAIAAFRTNKLQEAEESLVTVDGQINKGGSKLNYDAVANGAQGLYLLAQIYEKSQKKQQACECYFRAFQKNPTLFAAFERYLQLAEKTDQHDQTTAHFKSNKGLSSLGGTEISQSVFKNYLGSLQSMFEKENANLELDKQAKRMPGIEGLSSNQTLGVPKQSSSKYAYRTFKATSNDDQISSLTSSMKKASPSKQKKKTPAELVSNSNKNLFSNAQTSSQTKDMLFTGNPTNFILPQSNTGQPLTQNFINSNPNIIKQQPPIFAGEGNDSLAESQISIADYLHYLAAPYAKFLNHDPYRALDAFRSLKKPFDSDPWVLANIARCYTELSNHVEAEKYFKDVFSREPHRTDCVDFYSSCLWHLKKQAELSQLAYSCLEKHYFSPETWIAMANCFSLNQDHDTAISFLNRAIQIDSRNSYANCLLGHEYSSKENFEKAREFYQKAIELDPRNVRAFFGLGNLSLKTEKTEMAIDYFLNAITINDKCPTFYTQLGIAYMARNDNHKAMYYIRLAEDLCPTDQCNKFQKVQLLYRLKSYNEALQECEILMRDVKEAPIYTLLGQIQQKLNMKEQAHNNYTIASSLDRKEAQKVKNLIDSLTRSSDL